MQTLLLYFYSHQLIASGFVIFSGGKRIFIGRLSSRVTERDLERFFRGYGRVREVDLKNGYGFVELDSSRDAADAVHDLHGRYLLGDKVSVEMAREPRRTRGAASRYEPPERTEHRLIVENLSSRVTWQNLKDLMRRAGEITYADAHKTHRNEGVVEFASRSDMKRALEKYDGHELFGRRIKLTEDRDGAARRSFSRSRSGSRKGSRSKSRSKKRSRSRSRSRSGDRKRSPSRSRSHKRSASRSRSRSERRSRSGGRGSHQKHSRTPSEKRSRSGSRSSRSPSRNGDRENGKAKRPHDEDQGELSPKRRRRDSSASQRDRSHSKSRSRSQSHSPNQRKSSEERSRSPSQSHLADSKNEDNLDSSGSPHMDDSRDDEEVGAE